MYESNSQNDYVDWFVLWWWWKVDHYTTNISYNDDIIEILNNGSSVDA